MKQTSGLAVILVDMQDFFLKNFASKVKERLILEQTKIIDICIKKNIPLIALEYKAGGVDRGKTTSELERKILKGFREIIIKENNSGFTKTNLENILTDLKVKKLIVMGINANACVQDTAISALHRGYKVVTSLEIMASASNKDGKLSSKNKMWFKKNTVFFEKTIDLLTDLSR